MADERNWPVNLRQLPPKTVAFSFETFIFVLTGISFFYASNMKTMSDTLGSDLSDPDIKAKMSDDSIMKGAAQYAVSAPRHRTEPAVQ